MRDRPAELSEAMKAQVTSTEFLAGIVDTFTTASQVPQAQQLLTHLWFVATKRVVMCVLVSCLCGAYMWLGQLGE